MIKSDKYLIDSDILIDFLTNHHSRHHSYLVRLMQKGICFTTVLNAAELYFCSTTDDENVKLDHLFYAINVLGIHPRYSLLVPKVANYFKNYRDALFFIMAKQNKLIIVTKFPDKYSFGDCKVLHPSKLL